MKSLNIEPFNSVVFKDCYYNQFFPIINYLKLDIEYFMSNSIAIYGINGEIIKNIYIDRKSEDDLLLELGITKVINYFEYNSLLESIKESIDKNIPILIELQKHDGSFEKYILVIGYDGVTLKVIDRKQPDTLSYSLSQINLCEVIERQINYHKRMIKCISYTFSAKQIKHPNAFSNYCSNVKLLQSQIAMSLCELSNYIDNFKSIFINIRTSFGNELIGGLNDIINSCRVNVVILNNVANEHSEFLLARRNSILYNWSIIRSKLLKYYISGQKDIILDDIIAMLERVYLDEKHFYDYLNEVIRL